MGKILDSLLPCCYFDFIIKTRDAVNSDMKEQKSDKFKIDSYRVSGYFILTFLLMSRFLLEIGRLTETWLIDSGYMFQFMYGNSKTIGEIVNLSSESLR